MDTRLGRACYLVLVVVTLAALVLQLVLVVDGAATLLPESRPGLATRLVRFVGYFTILSNAAVLVSGVAALRGRRGRAWDVLRLDAVVAITVTGLVHWFLLRPLLRLHGASYLADRLLHLVVPVLAVLVWLLVGPRGLSRREVLPALAFPVAWLAWTLVHGAVTGWYPYPFVDVTLHGYAGVAVSCAGIAVLFVAAAMVAVAADRRLSGASSGTTPRRPTGRT